MVYLKTVPWAAVANSKLFYNKVFLNISSISYHLMYEGTIILTGSNNTANLFV